MTLMFLLACTLRIGRPPTGVAAPVVADVRVAAAEPALADALREGVAQAAVRRGLSVSGGAQAVTLEVLDAETSVVATGGGVQVHRARLSVACQVLEARPRRVVLAGERSYTVTAGETLAGADARAAAFAALAAELGEDAVDWILYGAQAGGGAP